MAVSDYLQKSGGVCRYSYSKLKDVLYLVSAEHVKNVHIDNGEAYIDELTELPLRINGFNIQFNEETSLDERYKFQKTLTLSMHGYVNYKIFGGRYYAIIEDMEGVFYMINVDFPSRITHTFNLNYNTNQTDFTFASLSNFPTLKLNAEFEAVSPVCLGLNVYGIDKLELLEKEKARLDTINKQVISTESFKKIEFLGNSCSFQEVYDGNKVTDTITFNIALDNYKPSWQYNLLEFLDNRYSAIITPKGNDNKYYPGYNFGLQPSYTIQTSNNSGESDIITITLVEMSSYGSTSAVDWKDEQSTETRWRWVKRVGDTVCFECIGLGRARYLVRQQVDLFGNPTGNYQVMEGYESEYPNFHIVDTFTTEEIFETSECSDSESCEITSNIPNTIYFNAITSNTYNLKASCDWEFIDIPNNIAVEPITGAADTDYTVTISNTIEPTSTALENSMKLRCCKTNKIINLKTQIDSSCIRPQRQYINCLSQDVVFAFDGNCRIDITSIDSRLTYAIGNNSLTVRVPRNYGDSAITWTIIATNCDCSSSSTIVYINQDKQYERWVVSDGYTCEDGNSYKVERKYTGTTQDNINTRTDETRKGELITSGDTRCTSSRTKWEWDGENYYCVNGNKFQAVFEYISYDDGVTWVKTGNTRLGDMVEESSDFCLSGVTYSWELTTRYECDGTTSYYLYQKYEQRGEQEPIPTYPNVFSKNGEGTMSLSKKQDNDPNCGYVPPVTTIYDWFTIDGYICKECESDLTKAILYPSSGSSINISGSGTLTRSELQAYSATTTNAFITNQTTEIGDEAFSAFVALEFARIPSTVTSIGDRAFLNCATMLECGIPSGVISIGYHAFGNCTSLMFIDIPNTVTTIGGSAFKNCLNFRYVSIPSSITSIPDSCFNNCDGLTDVELPSSINLIQSYAFGDCSSLTNVTCFASTPPVLGTYVFHLSDGAYRINPNLKIYVPASSVNDYKTASGWSAYADNIFPIT